MEAALYLGVVLALLPMKTPYINQGPATPRTRTPARARRASPLRDLAEGIRYVWKDEPAIFQIMLLSMVANVVIHPVCSCCPCSRRMCFNEGRTLRLPAGLKRVRGLGIGHDHCHGGFCLPEGQAALGSVVAAAIATIMFAYTPWLMMSIFLCALFSAGLNANRTASGTLVQLLVPDQLRSRIIGLQNYFMGFVVFTSLLIGWLAATTSVTTAIAAVGAVGLVLGVSYFILLGRVRNLD